MSVKESREQRSAIMRAVKGRDTAPEIAVRTMLRRFAPFYRLHRKDVPGTPDIAYIGRKRAIFVHGCFWHGHECPRGARSPKANADYWRAKIAQKRRARRGASDGARGAGLARAHDLGMRVEGSTRRWRRSCANSWGRGAYLPLAGRSRRKAARVGGFSPHPVASGDTLSRWERDTPLNPWRARHRRRPRSGSRRACPAEYAAGPSRARHWRASPAYRTRTRSGPSSPALSP